MEHNERAGLIIMLLTALLATVGLFISEPAYPSEWAASALSSISVIPLWKCDLSGTAWCFTSFEAADAYITRFGIPSRYVFALLLSAFAYGVLVYFGALRRWKR